MAFRVGGPDLLAIWRAPSVPATASGRDPLRETVIGLFEEFRVPLLRYASSFGLALEDAEEIVQEVFLSLYRHLQSGKSDEHIRAWLFRVAHNLALKRRCRNRKEEACSGAKAEVITAAPGPDPETQAAESQRQRRLHAAVEALPEQDRRCLLLRAEGLRYREIAAILEISLGSVSTSLSRALQRLARAGRM
jgi:RNA polymerase sigma-70 factor, ECF subfamily